MVQGWYLKQTYTNPQLPNKDEDSDYLNADELMLKIGVEITKLDADKDKDENLLDKISNERGYSHMDEIIISREELPDYDEKLKAFYEEHLHPEEEIRFILEGCAFFDCRDSDDKWIRMKVTKNDLITIPSGIYHRFTLDETNYLKAKRLFPSKNVWTAVKRPIGDNHPSREAYVNRSKNGFVKS